MKMTALTALFAAVAVAAGAAQLPGVNDVRFLGVAKWSYSDAQYSSDRDAEAKVLWVKPGLDDLERNRSRRPRDARAHNVTAAHAIRHNWK